MCTGGCGVHRWLRCVQVSVVCTGGCGVYRWVGFSQMGVVCCSHVGEVFTVNPVRMVGRPWKFVP